MRNKSPLVLLLVLCALLITCAGTSYAQSQPRITQQVDNRAYVPLPGNVRPEAKNPALVTGAVPSTQSIDHMFLFLQRSPGQEKAVDDYVNSLNDRNSPNFHKWLTAEEFGEQFGLAQEDVQQVTNWLQLFGFRINQVYPNRMVIDFSGTGRQYFKRLSYPDGDLAGRERNAHR